MNKRKWFALATGLMLGTAAVLGAATNIAQAQEDSERVQFMKKMGGNAGALGAVLRGEAEFNTGLSENAQAIADLVAELPDQFPAGSIAGGAKPEIWDNWDDFVSKAETVQSEATKLAVGIAANDEAGFQAQFLATVGACRSCHDTYRIPEEE